MKFNKNFTVLFSFLLLSTIHVSALTQCINEPTTLAWSSSNIAVNGCTLTPSTNNAACNFAPTADTAGSTSTSLSSGSCTVNLRCGSASATSTLTIDTTQIWNGSSCVTPSVVSAVITGQYYPPGTLNFTCSNSNTYTIRRDGTLFVATTTYSGPVTITPISLAGNYVIQCNQGSLISQVARAYSIIPNDAATVKLSVTPKNIVSGSNVTVKWDTTYPRNTCTLAARIVCANNACSAAQTAIQNTLNAILTSTTTDFNDPNTSRSITTAIRLPAPGHKDSDAVITTLDWKALGKKTLRITNTTDLIYDCGGTSKETKRIQVTKSSEQ